jgi:flagellar biosynthesis protein FliQ
MPPLVHLMQSTFEVAILISAPILAAAMIVSVIISLGQVMTSMQEMTVSTVPRLAAVAVFAVLLTPWMMHRLVMFTTQLFGDFHTYIR